MLSRNSDPWRESRPFFFFSPSSLPRFVPFIFYRDKTLPPPPFFFSLVDSHRICPESIRPLVSNSITKTTLACGERVVKTTTAVVELWNMPYRSTKNRCFMLFFSSRLPPTSRQYRPAGESKSRTPPPPHPPSVCQRPTLKLDIRHTDVQTFMRACIHPIHTAVVNASLCTYTRIHAFAYQVCIHAFMHPPHPCINTSNHSHNLLSTIAPNIRTDFIQS